MSDNVRGSVAVSAAKIGDDGLGWIEVMPTAEKARNGPWYFTITADDLPAVVASIKANADRISVDYDHAGTERDDTRAAGWFTGEAVAVRAGQSNPGGDKQDHDSVWAQIKWTPRAVQEIRDGEFRFISPEWSMAQTDKKTGLLTKFKALGAATLTNRPFFKNLAPVMARDYVSSDDLDALTARYGEGAARVILAGLDQNAEKSFRETIAGLLEPKSQPENNDADPALREDGTKQGDEVELSTLAASLGLPEDADEKTVLAKVEEHKQAAQAANEKEEDVAEKSTDYLKMLGLKEDADAHTKIAAALNKKDEDLLAMRAELTEAKAKLADSEKLNDRIADLEQRDRQRDIEVLLRAAVDDGKIYPAEKETLGELFSDNVKGLRTLLATRPANMAARKPKGIVGDPDRYADDVKVAAEVKSYKGDIPVDTESVKLDLRAKEILRERNKDENDADAYLEAVEEAAVELAAA